MSAKSKARRRKSKMKWVEAEGGKCKLEDLRTDREKAADQARQERAARRQAQIKSGVTHPAGRGGVHGGSVEQNNRRDRKEAKQKLQRGEY